MLSTTALIAKHHPAPPAARLPPPLPAITTGTARTRWWRGDRPLQSRKKAWASYCPPTLVLRSLKAFSRSSVPRCRRLKDASEQDDIQEKTTETAEVSNEVASSTEEPNSSDSSEKLFTKDSEKELRKEEQGEVAKVPEKIKQGEEQKLNREETGTGKTSDSELATITRSASSDDGVLAPKSGIAKQAEPRQESKTDVVQRAITVDRNGGRISSSGPSAAVGEWNSLPVLVERLREALELSLTSANCRRGSGDEADVSVGVENGGDWSCSHRRSLEQALLLHGCEHNDPAPRKEELKFLEDLLLSDIQTALARLRETLEHTNVTTLAKHGVSDPSSKLHLLRLVSSLLSRLQVPEQARELTNNGTVVDVGALNPDGLPARRRRGIRHTIGVSAEELARARKQLEESSVDLARLKEQVFSQSRRESLLATPYNATNGERHAEEIHDKYTKDVINQRQSLRDKNKDIPHGDTVGAYRAALLPPQIGYADCPVANETSSSHQPLRRRSSIDNYQEKDSDDEETTRRTSEEQSQATRLAAVLRQRAELVSAGKGCANGNKFAAKKSRIKRANTVDIPSYLRLQAESNLGSYDNPCILLRRPINVSDRINPNVSNYAVLPSFQPKTENDKKFLALINRNNETQSFNATPTFVKSFGYSKTTDMSSLTNENWNSRFSNIKTAFDKPSTAISEKNKLMLRSHPAKHLPTTLQTCSQIVNNKKALAAIDNSFSLANASNTSKPDARFRHAPSSLFRKIEKPQSPKSQSNYHWQRDNSTQSAGITLREKAKIMFDRDCNNSQPQSSVSKFHASDHSQKSTFPRPPWIQHDRNEGKSGNMVTENGRLDYRLFCKQFAPFIGKGNASPELKKSLNIEHSRKREGQQSITCSKNFTPSHEKLGVIDGKISFKMFPVERASQQYHSSENSHREGPTRDKFDLRSERDVFVPNVHDDKNSTFLGSSSVASQTGVSSDDHPEEARVFRVAPRAPRGTPSTYNNASVQTQNESETERWMMPRYEDNFTSNSNLSHHPLEDPRRFVLEHNQNYYIVPMGNAVPQSETSPLADKNTCDLSLMEKVLSPVTGYHSPEQSKSILQTKSYYENNFPPIKSPFKDRESQMYANYVPCIVEPIKNEDQLLDTSEIMDKGDFFQPHDNVLPAEQHIENQDISIDAGVVTRYTCAIATVATANMPEVRSEPTTGPESEASSSSSPSQFWSHPSSGETTTEDKIRRHNMLQQSLVRRLQNERATLKDYHAPVPTDQPAYCNLNDQTSNFQQSKILGQPSNFNQPPKLQPSKRLEPPKIVEPSRKSKPPAIIGLLSVAPSSGLNTTNRITALREQYEQPSDQTKAFTRKERSPIPNGVSSSMDSSDEYLVSCVNKPSRSIVLSKSESWHQLALVGSQHYLSREQSHGGLPPPSQPNSYLLKPPKPKSPSSFRMKKQYEASSSSDSVRRMEDKIRRYFDSPADNVVDTRDSKARRASSRDSAKKNLIGLSRSHTMPGICNNERLHLTISTDSPQIPAGNLNTAEVDKVFDDIFEEATKTDDYRF